MTGSTLYCAGYRQRNHFVSARELVQAVEVAGIAGPTRLVIEAIDGVRRRRMGAEAIADHLSSALEAMKGYDSEVRGLRPPASAAGARDRVVAELERAARALEMVEHGCAILMSARIGGRELEAQTAIKRGYLNLLHAREAILQAGTEAVAFRPEEENRWLTGRRA